MIDAIAILRNAVKVLPERLAAAGYPAQIDTGAGTFDLTYTANDDGIVAAVALDMGEALIYRSSDSDGETTGSIAVVLAPTSAPAESSNSLYEYELRADGEIAVRDEFGNHVDSYYASDENFGQYLAVLIDDNTPDE